MHLLPLADVYGQIIKDFTEAAADLPTYSAAGTGKPAFKGDCFVSFGQNLPMERIGLQLDSQPIFTVHIPFQKTLIDNKATYG